MRTKWAGAWMGGFGGEVVLNRRATRANIWAIWKRQAAWAAFRVRAEITERCTTRPAIEADAVGGLEPAGRAGQIGAGCLEQAAVVVAEQAVGMDDEAEPADGFFEGFEETLAIGWVAIDVLPLVSSCGDVVDGVLEFDSDGSCHAGILRRDGEFVKSQELTPYPNLDPFIRSPCSMSAFIFAAWAAACIPIPAMLAVSKLSPLGSIIWIGSAPA